jgi:hypothetical protein
VVSEFIIQRTDGDYFGVHKSQYAKVLRPIETPSRPIDGWGDHRIVVDGAEISFSFEPPGFQVVFETGALDADRQLAIVTEILRSIERATGQRGQVIAV